MKFLLGAINAKYIHTSLAVRCLYRAVKDDFDVEMCEYTVNESLLHISSSIYRKHPDVIAIGCYIWNYNTVRDLCDNIKKASPHTYIILGGPEVSYNPQRVLSECSADAVVMGEGEITICELFGALERGDSPKNVLGVAYRDGDIVIVNSQRPPIQCLDDLPFVYDGDTEDYANRILYYESSRGCPFSCSYCLSGEKGKVRYLSIDRVKKDIDYFVSHKVPLVKFVDRTFNADRRRAREIFRYIIDNAGDTCFHMELAGDLLDEETIELLSLAPANLMQFEIGVQTTNERTMEAIRRKIRQKPLFDNIKKLISNGNIHIHLDLIAGLPYEDINSFTRSFNEVMELEPHILQIGFLKLLHGSAIRKDYEKFNYRYTKNAPYEVISNDFVSYDDILLLHDIEDVFERYYNSGDFKKTTGKLAKMYNGDYFSLYRDIARYFTDNGLFDLSLSKHRLYNIIFDFCLLKGIDIEEYLKYDYIVANRCHNLPNWCRTYRDKTFEDCCYSVLKDEEFKKQYLPNYYDVPAKKAIKTVFFEKFSEGVLLFDYDSDKIINVSEYFE